MGNLVTKILYHQTDESSAQSIISSQRMYRGTSGLAGGGIYFAETPSATDVKAHRRGVTLRAKVRVGREKVLGPDGDSSITYSSLVAQGYDSVLITGRSSGNEYVVYNWDQVTEIERVLCLIM